MKKIKPIEYINKEDVLKLIRKELIQHIKSNNHRPLAEQAIYVPELVKLVKNIKKKIKDIQPLDMTNLAYIPTQEQIKEFKEKYGLYTTDTFTIPKITETKQIFYFKRKGQENL